ncbi:replication initiation protein [Photobacterium damselae]|nr:replication initiation protein [Photobacterium damselae]KAB1174990.1 replication initiation protein [Photobacterium damselae subsp. damselae]KAB1180241.1 replication initiation protein [Photobacterium damselae subsp. damselae]MBF7100787.1 replication initiation protein [Photobacterium damselae]NVO73649.1 replication initiation protein [Photobacterium damselae subsp. damselae]PSB82347.1 replication initiation protein [Photobacterium damselae subsp. damselae]
MKNEEQYYPIVSDCLPKHIKKGHQLVFSRQDLSAREADMFALMIAHMKGRDWEQSTPHYEFTSHQLSEWLGVEPKHIGSNLSPVANRLASRKIGIKQENSKGDIEFDYRPLFKHIAYKKGILTMVPNDMLKSEYIEYNQGFALINTRVFFDIKKEYSKRLYELLSRFKSKGFEMHTQSLIELKGIFGLLDEAGKLKKDKASFKNNSVFMKRCIRDSIKDLSEHPQINKELLFIDSDNGDKGFELVKKGREITGVKFLFRWIKLGTIDELNQHEAIKTIKHLELKRLQENIKLIDTELETLAIAYRYVGRDDKAATIEEALAKRHFSQKNEKEEVLAVQKEVKDFLDKIESFAETNGNPDY